ncbi:MAG: hypothetical protein N2169_03755 [bacterium]|nr:hypothetical protein [bacterium]
MEFEQILDHFIYNLNQLRISVGDNIVFSKLNANLKPINTDFFNNTLYSEILNLYLSKFSKNVEHDSPIIQIFQNNIQNINELGLEELQDYYQVVSAVIIFVNDLLNSLRREKQKGFKTVDFFLLTEIQNEFPKIKEKIVSNIVSNLESFIKIRGDYIGEEIKHNALEIINRLKNEQLQIEKFQEIDELFSDIIRRVQDYEYYIISKDRAFTVVPSSYIWFEFLIHTYYLYENQININSFIELYEKRLIPSFGICKTWYKNFYNNIFCRSSLKVNTYGNIIYTIEEVEKYLSSLFIEIKEKYPEKVEIDDQNLSNKIIFLLQKTEEIQSFSKQFDTNKLKGTGIFENFYSILKEVFAERETILTLYDFYNSLSSTISYLEEYEPDFLTPLDKRVIENKEKFEQILELILKYIQELNKDYLVDLAEYFETNIESIIISVREDYSKLEKLLEPEKIVCINCGYQNELYTDSCVKCGKKLIKVHTEPKSTIKTIFSKLAKITNSSEISSYAVILMNILNNSLSTLENIRVSIEGIKFEESQSDFITELINKMNSVIEDIIIIREKISFIINNEITLEEFDEIITEIEPITDELDKKIEYLYSTVKSLIET